MLSKIIAALVMVESGGDPGLVGDHGRALGALQIHQEVIQDVNRIYGTQYTHRSALAPRHARRICELYVRHYAGPGASPERIARIWNGGPGGPRKPATVFYWRRVKARL